MANFITGIISLTVGVVILANVFIVQVKSSATCAAGTLGANCNGTTGWGTYPTGAALTTTELAMWGLISLVAIIGIVYGVLNVFGLT